jgi:RNA recognition motif-containing protein
MPEYFGFCRVPFWLAGKGGRQELKEVFFMSAAKLYVGNLNYRTTEDKLKELFSQYGEVNSVNVLQGRGFGFVEMATQESAQDAKAKLNGTDFDGRRIIVNEARPRTERRGGERRERRDFDKF